MSNGGSRAEPVYGRSFSRSVRLRNCACCEKLWIEERQARFLLSDGAAYLIRDVPSSQG